MAFLSTSHNQKNFFNIVLLSCLLITLVASTILVQQKHLFQKWAAGGAYASLSLGTSTLTTEVGQSFDISVLINTDGAEIRGADVILKFFNGRLRLTDIQPTVRDSLHTFLPVTDTTNCNFDKNTVINNANSTGIIEFSAITFDCTAGTDGEITNAFQSSSNETLATLTFEALTDGPATISYCLCQNCGAEYNPSDICTSRSVINEGITWDTNLASIVGSSSVDILAFVNNLKILVGPIIGDIVPDGGDGCVDEKDYAAIIALFGNTDEPGTVLGDIVPEGGDGCVDEKDYAAIIVYFGVGAGCID